MTADRYAEWLARGRTHQADNRFIDALLCYRRALHEAPRGADAQFHIGEIAWQMGNRADALAAWRAASEMNPAHLASWHALADALAATGDVPASETAVDRVLALREDEPRANALRVLLRASSEAVPDAVLAHAVACNAWPLALLVRVIERVFASGRQHELPQAAAALLAGVTSAHIVPGEEDDLRRIALALANAGEADGARAFADRYGHACRALHAGSMPLAWPRRTAGDALRIGVLVVSEQIADAQALRAALARADMSNAVESIVLVGAQGGGLHPSSGDTRTLPGDAAAAARAVATLDLDVLIDVAGVRYASGGVLALRPARSLWAVERTGVPASRPLVDRFFPDESGVGNARGDADWRSVLIGALRELRTDVAAAPASSISAAELSARWETAVLAHQRGDIERARERYTDVLDMQPDHAAAWYLMGELARAGKDEPGACAAFRNALRVAPAYVDARVALVNALLACREVAQALAVAREGVERQDASAALWRVLGHAQLASGDAAAAIDAFERSLQRDPTHGETHYNQGVALQTARRPADAARAYQRALAFRPDLHSADFNLGVIFDQQGNASAAIGAFTNVLRRAPDHVAAYKALGETLRASGRYDAWFANFERFERHCPDRLALAVQALEVCAHRADFARLERYLDGLRHERFAAEDPEEMLDALQQLLYLLHFFDVEPELIGRHARTHDALSRRFYGAPWPRRIDRAPGKPRIGYISGDFRNHVMGKMMWEAIRRHDRTRFDVFAYATGAMRDEWTARFESIASIEPLDALTDAAAARRIASDDLDILVDLSTHTKGARPGILAVKPARVQITHVASAGTLGMSAIDFKLTDRYADVDGNADDRVEPLLAMEGCVYPYRHVAASPTSAFSREALGIAQSAMVIGAFCTPLKLSQRCLMLWREVLARVPQALLAFSPLQPSLRAVFQRIADVAGIERTRIVFVPQGRDDAEGQARYRLVDFVLDPMPYGGVNGTLEALDMGVPVVTLLGRRHAERTSYSILANLGVTETIAHTGSDYVAIAARLAADAGFMRSVRQRIAERLRDSALTDMDAHTRSLEAAYERALAMRAPEALAAVR